MRADEVPKDSAPLLEGVTKAAYALDENNRYVIVPNGGTEAEITVTEEAVAWFERLAQAAYVRARQGEACSLEYHMYRQRLDVPTLAQATGMWQWQVRRHLRPAVFARLSAVMLERYADAMGLTAAQLRSLD
jgi:hypothetical protein